MEINCNIKIGLLAAIVACGGMAVAQAKNHPPKSSAAQHHQHLQNNAKVAQHHSQVARQSQAHHNYLVQVSKKHSPLRDKKLQGKSAKNGASSKNISNGTAKAPH